MTDHSLAIHRLLDEAFAGTDMTPEVRDLKEEMRSNLVARMGELERSGVSSEAAAQRAMAELGDIRSIIADMGTPSAAPWMSPGSIDSRLADDENIFICLLMPMAFAWV